MITAIITQLKTGSISNVIARFDGVKNPERPYVTVWEDSRTQLGNAQATGGIFVSVNADPGDQDTINNYLNNEVITLLHKVNLTDEFGNTFRLLDSNELSPLIDVNDDNTISRDRLFILPELGAV